MMRRPMDRQIQADIALSMIVGVAVIDRVLARCLHQPKPDAPRHANDTGAPPPQAA